MDVWPRSLLIIRTLIHLSLMSSDTKKVVSMHFQQLFLDDFIMTWNRKQIHCLTCSLFYILFFWKISCIFQENLNRVGLEPTTSGLTCRWSLVRVTLLYFLTMFLTPQIIKTNYPVSFPCGI